MDSTELTAQYDHEKEININPGNLLILAKLGLQSYRFDIDNLHFFKDINIAEIILGDVMYGAKAVLVETSRSFCADKSAMTLSYVEEKQKQWFYTH